MPNVIELLKNLNRKERYWLLSQALGEFGLSAAYREQLGQVLNLQIPDDAFVAMDYHYDWLYAAVCQNVGLATAAYDNEHGKVSGDIRDVDLLVAYQSSLTTHIVVVEAKACTLWKNKQMMRKIQRLQAIFGDSVAPTDPLQPHLLLMSRRRPVRLATKDWPDWTKTNGTVAWLELRLPTDSLMVIRSDANGQRTSKGSFWALADGLTGRTKAKPNA